MLHLGDICKINGAEIEPVWCITGGSPCQDLSIAGKRAGLAGARSGLFMEQVRIVKEMREADKRNGRTGEMVRPRYLVWENVVGAFSSNKGKDFAAVLEEIIKIVEPEAPGIEVPEKGWPTWGGYHDEVGGRWSVVWRTHDAQYWGVPQRRRRISVVADFGGDTASEIQFDRESLSGDIAESGAAGEGSAEAAERGFNPAVGDCMTAWNCQSKRIFDTNGKSPTLQGGVGGGVNNPAIFCMATQQGGAELRTDDRAPTLTAAAGMSGNNQPVVAIPINDKATRWQGGGESRNHDGGGNDQTIFCLQGNGIDRADTAGCNGKGWKTDENYTLNTIDRPAVCAEVACMNPWDAQSARVYDQDGAWHSLNANENGGMARDSVLCAGFKAGQGAQAGGIGYSEEVSPTLAAAPSGTNQTPAVMAFDTTQITSKENGSQPGFGKPCHTLNANAHVPCVALDMTHACDVIRECGEQTPSLQARMGTGGNQVPLTYQMNGFGDYRAAEVASSCKQRDFKDSTDLAITNMVVRRLTPMEYERLQGFPDGWTDIGDWVKTDKRGREIKVKGSADSPRYKALGNSIALPFWDWMLRRMARYLPADATLGSLFDGIAGFPLIWERIHGKGTARWASEIEPFPIAVTKKHFPEEE